jgi:hypothetical protein
MHKYGDAVMSSFESAVPRFSFPAGRLVWKGDSSRSFRALSAAGVSVPDAGGAGGCVRRQVPASGTILEFSRRQLLVPDAVPGVALVAAGDTAWSDVAFQFRTTAEGSIASGRLAIFASSDNFAGPDYAAQPAYVASVSAAGDWWHFPTDFVLRPAVCYWLLAEVAMPFGIGCGATAAELLAADAPGQEFSPLSGFSPLFCLRGTPLQSLPITWHGGARAVDAAIVKSGSAGSAGLPSMICAD